ncbi:MAG: hypothetical protein HY421_02800 [Candidatus Kerfeldbacteria bacterium]|nr:hypothetical protein [Candidatus Kerfeldbacteria bacterium]
MLGLVMLSIAPLVVGAVLLYRWIRRRKQNHEPCSLTSGCTGWLKDDHEGPASVPGHFVRIRECTVCHRLEERLVLHSPRTRRILEQLKASALDL